ncbi:hypothetical protein [Nakamurella deserti]|nr:hypothetical protein [Nakamurella deserti]
MDADPPSAGNGDDVLWADMWRDALQSGFAALRRDADERGPDGA